MSLSFSNNISIEKWSSLISGRVFYAPILGPVQAGEKNKTIILQMIADNIDKTEFLDFDKNKRWFEAKKENILPELCVEKTDHILIATYDSFFQTLKLYFYSKRSADENDIKTAEKLAASAQRQIDHSKCVFYCFQKPKLSGIFQTNNIYLKLISEKDRLPIRFRQVIKFEDLEQTHRKTFSDFADEEEHDGLNYIWQEYLSKNVSMNPLFCYLEQGKIIGAIGPLDFAVDAYGKKFLQPPYFGVLAKSQKKGVGKSIWQAAMDYASRHKTEYTLVQNTPDSPAARFYEKQGLAVSGQVFTITIKN